MHRPIDVPASGLHLAYEQLHADLLRFLVARVGDRSEAEDLLQDLWLRIQATDTGPIGNMRAYLFRSAQNLALDRARRCARRERRESDFAVVSGGGANGQGPVDPSPTADDAMIESEDVAALAAAIAALPTGAGRAFRLHKLEGRPHADVAAIMGITRSGVEKHIATALAHLRRALKD